MLLEYAQALEQSAFGLAAKGWPWLYPVANIAHVVGAGLLLGAIVVFDSLLMRREPDLARQVSGVALKVAVTGFVLAVASAPVLFASDATALITNPALLVKLILIAGALTNIAVFYSRSGFDVQRGELAAHRAHALVSASLWIGILISGRAIAYV